tara:strand:+ start:1545 stop:2954 length:1410 start_codon:yes stop_codon:yes gene_type:complete
MIDKLTPRILQTSKDFRAMEQTEMLDALNITVTGDEDGGAGVLKNIKGTKIVPGVQMPGGENIVIGSTKDETLGVTYFFVWNENNNHGVYAYSAKTNSYRLILQTPELNFDRNGFVKGDIIRIKRLPEDRETLIFGCTDPTALNYNSEADYDDGSCIYTPDEPLEDIMIPPHPNLSFAVEDVATFDTVESYNISLTPYTFTQGVFTNHFNTTANGYAFDANTSWLQEAQGSISFFAPNVTQARVFVSSITFDDAQGTSSPGLAQYISYSFPNAASGQIAAPTTPTFIYNWENIINNSSTPSTVILDPAPTANASLQDVEFSLQIPASEYSNFEPIGTLNILSSIITATVTYSSPDDPAFNRIETFDINISLSLDPEGFNPPPPPPPPPIDGELFNPCDWLESTLGISSNAIITVNSYTAFLTAIDLGAEYYNADGTLFTPVDFLLILGATGEDLNCPIQPDDDIDYEDV